MVQGQRACGNSVIVLDRRFQLCEDIFHILRGSRYGDGLGVEIFLTEGLLLLGGAAVGIQVTVVFKVLFHQILRVLIRKKGVDFDCELLSVQILIGNVISNIAGCTGIHTETETERDGQDQGHKLFFHGIEFPFFK